MESQWEKYIHVSICYRWETLYATGTMSHNVPEKFLKEHNCVDTHDGHSGYIKLAKITEGNGQAWCLPHIIKDAKELIEYNKEEDDISTIQ